MSPQTVPACMDAMELWPDPMTVICDAFAILVSAYGKWKKQKARLKQDGSKFGNVGNLMQSSVEAMEASRFMHIELHKNLPWKGNRFLLIERRKKNNQHGKSKI